jgi:dTDP-4-amino-4,6-dideoxygalactose transaminase
MARPIPFNRPHITGDELRFIAEAIGNIQLSSNGMFTRRCQNWLEEQLGTSRVLLTHSCTGALEMAALLAGIGPGDEVIMPSFTFVSTANAVVLRDATPVFVDIRPDTLNIDEDCIGAAITHRTRAISVVHYAGVAANMDAIRAIARRHDLIVMEDAAQGLFASYHGQPLGTFGALGAVSFHETKNVISGEGGALIVNDPDLIERAEILWEKGTDRSRFRRGEIDRYTWHDVGSSYAPSEILAAFLWAQLQHGDALTTRRRDQWTRYHEAFRELEHDGLVRRPIIPNGAGHNAHLYYLLLPSAAERAEALDAFARLGVNAIFHYVPLHNSPAGLRYGRAAGTLPVTEDAAARLIRLPLHADLSWEEQARVIGAVHAVCGQPAVCRA